MFTRFAVNYYLSAGNIESGGVVDEDGELLSKYVVFQILLYGSELPLTKNQSIGAIGNGSSNSSSLEVEDDFGDLTLIGWTKDQEVHFQYSVQLTPLSESRSAAYGQLLSLRTAVVAALFGCAISAMI
jgi:hypothetical protein